MTWTPQPRSEGPGGLSYVRSGAGAPLVLIHGVGLRAEAWAAMMSPLARHFTVHAVDMPGHGGSALADAECLTDYVARFLAFMDRLDGPVRVAGHSMGAMIALQLAAARPGKVCAVAALNAVYRRSEAATQAVRARAGALDGASVPDPSATLQRWFGAAPAGETRRAADACATWLTGADPKGYARAYAVFAGQDGPLDTDLERLDAPALFLTGQQDPNSTPTMSQGMAAIAPHGRAQIIAGAAHMMPMTHAGQAAAALLEVFGTVEMPP